jgi:hypothetical protein
MQIHAMGMLRIDAIEITNQDSSQINFQPKINANQLKVKVGNSINNQNG